MLNQSFNILGSQIYYFAIGPDGSQQLPQGSQPTVIPANYFCSWNASIDPSNKYDMSVTRNRLYQAEELTMVLSSSLSTDILTDSFLSSAGSGGQTQFRILYPDQIQVYALNRFT